MERGADDTVDEADELGGAWERFAGALGDYLRTMVDPEEGDHLLVELPSGDPDGCSPYAQFAGFDGGRMLRAELSGDSFLAPQHRLSEEAHRWLVGAGWAGNVVDGAPEERNWHRDVPVAEAGEVAREVVSALRDRFGTTHPELLTHRAWGPASAGVEVLGLCASEDVPLEAPDVDSAIAHLPEGRPELVALVRAVLRATYDGEPEVDEDGDFVLQHEGQPVWVRVRAEQPAVEIMTRVAHEVRSRRSTAVELSLLNRDNLWVRWTLRERTVWQTLVLPGMPFVPEHLRRMLALYLEALSETREDLVLRLGARPG
jgi:hypothetical protein